MKLHFSLSLVATALVLAACTTTTTGPTSSNKPAPSLPAAPAPATPAEPEAEEEPYELFGEPLNGEVERVSFADILANPDAYDGKEVLSNGTVRASCQKRGCWMEVRTDEARDGASATIRFKDYGFFMPLDSRGARVMLQGIVQVTILTKGEVLEMEAEGGTVVDKRPDGSAKALLIISSGVQMRGRAGMKK